MRLDNLKRGWPAVSMMALGAIVLLSMLSLNVTGYRLLVSVIPLVFALYFVLTEKEGVQVENKSA